MNRLKIRMEAVGRYLRKMTGDLHLKASRLQARGLMVEIQRIKVLSLDDFEYVSQELVTCGFADEDKAMLGAALEAKIVTITGKKRPLQDGVSLCSGYLTNNVISNAVGAETVPILSKHFSAMGLVSPTEPTSARIAALAAVVPWGPACALRVPDWEVQHLYSYVKEEIKRLFKGEPQEYVMTYPKTALEFLELHPNIARAVFTCDNLPVTSPYSDAAIEAVYNTIQQRGWSQTNHSSQIVQWMATCGGVQVGRSLRKPLWESKVLPDLCF